MNPETAFGQEATELSLVAASDRTVAEGDVLNKKNGVYANVGDNGRLNEVPPSAIVVELDMDDDDDVGSLNSLATAKWS